MPHFNIRADSVNVEQIMEQIRARIREKRGVDYTEQQIRELAAVKLEKFLDPRGVRSDLLDQFRRTQPPPPERSNYAFEAETLFETHRAPVRWIRRLLRPLLKLLFNPNPLIQALHIQSQLNITNAERESARHAVDQLYYEVMHNLVIEMTRIGIEMKNLKMRVESVASRLEFNERRARALESTVVYRPTTSTAAPAPPTAVEPAARRDQVAAPSAPAETAPEGPGQRSRRRRRRRGRRGGVPAAAIMSGVLPADQGAEAPGPSDAPEEAAHEVAGAHDESTGTGEPAIPSASHPAEPFDEGQPPESGSGHPAGIDDDQ